jgi:hypothetical protein
MTRVRKVFVCDRGVYLRAKQQADDEGVLFSRYVERAVAEGMKDRPPGHTKPEGLTHDLEFKCDRDLFRKVKQVAHAEGTYLARWLERQLEAYLSKYAV